MKTVLKLVVGALFLLVSYRVALPAAASAGGLCCRLADHCDLPEILNLHQGFGMLEHAGLLVRPTQEAIAEKLASDIAAERLFVAEQDGELAGFLKLFAVTDRAELAGILHEELNIHPAAEPETGPIRADGAPVSVPSTVIAGEDPGTAYVYVGYQYTTPARRGARAQGTLLRRALDALFGGLLPERVALLFGQAAQNVGHQGPTAAFVAYADDHDFAGRRLAGSRLQYPTRKPIFQRTADGSYQLSIPEGLTDRGNMVYLQPEDQA